MTRSRIVTTFAHGGRSWCHAMIAIAAQIVKPAKACPEGKDKCCCRSVFSMNGGRSRAIENFKMFEITSPSCDETRRKTAQRHHRNHSNEWRNDDVAWTIGEPGEELRESEHPTLFLS